MADQGRLDYLKNAQRLSQQNGPVDAAGRFHRVSLFRTNMKYPLIRVEDVMGPGQGGNPVSLSETAAVADHVMVQLQPGSSGTDLQQVVAKSGATLITTPHAGLYLVQLPNATADTLPLAIQSLGKYPGLLKYAEADSIVHASAIVPNDPSFAGEWGLHDTGQTSGTANADIDAEDAWGVIKQSPNVLVAVIDTGIDFNHPDLQANIWTNPNPGKYGYANDLHGWNFYANNNTPQDDHFHGTHVSGTIGAAGNNGVGVTGVTWQVKIVPLKFLSSNGSGYTSDAINAIYYASAIGARIMSNSWGGGAYSQALKDAIDAANSAGALFVVAAGNDGLNTDQNPTYPADYTSANIISVAATDDTDHLANFSNYGTTSVQLAAPGVGVLSTFPTVATSAMISEGLPTSYGQISGTSMATPHVSGVAALALAQNPSLTVAQLRALLIQRVTQLPQLSGVIQTAGRLNAYNVVNTSWQPAGVQLQTTAVAMDDSEGNKDGVANPGEVIDFTPTILNSGGITATNVTVNLVSQQTTATVLTSSINMGNLLAFAQAKPGPFRVQLSSSLADKTTLTFDLVLSADGVTAIHTPVSVVVSKPQASSEATVAFACGEIKADPTRNLVYLIDTTNARIDAIDTALGDVAATSILDATPSPSPLPSGQKNQIGQMAISLDGTRLYLALTTQQEIEIFSLPSLLPVATLPVNFSPVGLATGINGRLFASSTDNWGQLREVNPNNGNTVAAFNKGNNQAFYAGTLLRTNLAGTRLYAADTNIIGPGETIYPYDISSGGETLLATYTCPMENLLDFGIDEQQNRIYTINGGVYGVGLTDMTTGASSTVWPFVSAYGAGLAFLPNDTVIYGASGDPNLGDIRKFNRTAGTPLGDYIVGKNGTPIKTRGIAITPNGVILYVRSNGTATSYIGLIGGPLIIITNPPPPTATPAMLTLATVPFSDSEGNGDGVANPGEVIALTPSFKNIGGSAGTHASVSLSLASGATLLTPSGGMQSLGTVASGVTTAVPAPYRIQLSPGLADGTAINCTFTVTWDTGNSQQFIYTQIVHTSVTISQLTTALQFGEILADQQRDLVYIVDKLNLRLLVFDTDGGHVAQAVPLGGLTTINGSPAVPGMMAQSVDGSKLFIALPQSQMIQEFSLPDMTTLAQWSYNFQPESLSCDAQGRVYCTTYDPTQKLVQIDGTSGAVLTQSGPAFKATPGNPTIPSILHRNAAGTELYGSLNNLIYRFSTVASGSPTFINTVTLKSGFNVIDYTVDEQDARFYAVIDDGNLTLAAMNGTSVTATPLNSMWGSAVAYFPGNNYVLGASDYWYGGGIRKFSRTDNSTIQDYVVDNNSNSITPRGLATTPNGRTVFVRLSASGNGYTLGMIGGAVNLDIPPGTPIGTLGIVLTDPAPGSNDGFVHSGQTVQLLPTFKNFTSSLISNVSIDLLSADPLAVVQSPVTSTIGNVASYVAFSPTNTFKVAIGAAATDGHELKLTFRINYNNGTQQLIPYSLFVSNPIKAQAAVSFAVGAMIADRTRDLAYVIDNTNNRVLAIDTDLGTVSKTTNLLASPGLGQMAISFDGSLLYVALTAAQQIQVFHLPDLTQVDVINLNFQPSTLAAPADGKIYASEINGYESFLYLHEVDPTTGQNVGPFGHRTYFSSSAGGGPLIRITADGKSFYVVETGLSGYDDIDQYTVSSSGFPTFTQAISFLLSNTADIEIDDQLNRIYSTGGGTYGVNSYAINTGITTFWPFGTPYGGAVAFLPSSNFVYGGSVGPYDSKIRRFNRADGTPLSDINLATGVDPYPTLVTNGMVITANGHILYALSSYTGNSGYTLGIIGCSSISMTPPTAAPAIYAGSDQTIHLSQAASLAATIIDSTANLPVTWNVISGTSGATINSASATSAVSFPSVGVYRLQGSTSQGGLSGSDLINVTVIPDLPAVSVTAPIATAAINGEYGQLTFTRTGTPSGNLVVNYTTSGTARNGIDYVALPGTITIPNGAVSSTVPLIAQSSAATSVVNVTVSVTASYQLGVSQAAAIAISPLVPTTFSQWSTSHNLTTGVTGTPENDGTSNLLKYLVDIDPTRPMTTTDLAGIPTVGIDSTTTPNTPYLALTYRMNPAASGIVVGLQTSTDLQTWQTTTPDINRQSGTDAATGDPLMEMGIKVPADAHVFIRLNVTSQ